MFLRCSKSKNQAVLAIQTKYRALETRVFPFCALAGKHANLSKNWIQRHVSRRKRKVSDEYECVFTLLKFWDLDRYVLKLTSDGITEFT